MLVCIYLCAYVSGVRVCVCICVCTFVHMCICACATVCVEDRGQLWGVVYLHNLGPGSSDGQVW